MDIHSCSPPSSLAILDVYKESKDISIKILKDVGMTVPQSREKSAVYKVCEKHLLKDVRMTMLKSSGTRFRQNQ